MSGINGNGGSSGTDINGDPTGGGLTPAQQQTLDDVEEKTLYQSTTTPPDTTNFDGALTLNGVPVGGGGSNPFDQDLNTFDSPQFVNLELENNILFRDPTSGSEMILVSDNGLHKIETSGGSSGNNDLTIETDELRFEANGNLITQVAGNLSENISANKTIQINANKIETITASHQITASSHLFNGPINFNSPVTGSIINCNTVQSITQLTFGASSNIQILSPLININATSITTNSRITTTQTSFTNPQEYITKDYVDNALPLPPTLQDVYTNGNTIFTSGGNPVSILGVEGLEVSNNAVITAKTTFTNPQELVSKAYVDGNVVKFNPSVDTILYEDANIIINWITADSQPSFELKIPPAGPGAFGDWVDCSISFIGGGAGTQNNGDGTNAVGVKCFFYGATTINATFDHINYGSTSYGLIIPETDITYPTYKLTLITGDISQSGTSKVEIY